MIQEIIKDMSEHMDKTIDALRREYAKIRTGRLDEAQHILEAWATAERQEAERGHLHPPRSHRETVLLLALIHVLRGQRERQQGA